MIDVQMISTDPLDVGPFVVEGQGHTNWTTGPVLMYSYQTYTVSAPAYEGDQITIQSDSWITPNQVDICFSYVVQGGFTNPPLPPNSD